MDPLAKIAPYRKAVAALVAGPLVAAWLAVDPGSLAGAAIDVKEWLGIVFAALVPTGAVYAVPNASMTVAPAPDPGDGF